MTSILDEAGFQIIWVRDRPTAETLALEEKPEVAVVELRLPGGWDRSG